MITYEDTRAIKIALEKHRSAQERLDRTRVDLYNQLRLAKSRSGATLAEIGSVVGVSRQRIHQIMKEEE